MGKITMGILGPLSQSIGGVTGASFKGKATLRRKSSGGVNPRTEAQQEKRSAFGEASEYCRENRAAIIEYCGFKEKKGVTIWNQMMSWFMAGGRLPGHDTELIPVTLGGQTYNELMYWDTTSERGVKTILLPPMLFENQEVTKVQISVDRFYDTQWQTGRGTTRQDAYGVAGGWAPQPLATRPFDYLPQIRGLYYKYAVRYQVSGSSTWINTVFVATAEHAKVIDFELCDLLTNEEVIEALSPIGKASKVGSYFDVNSAIQVTLPTGSGNCPVLAQALQLFAGPEVITLSVQVRFMKAGDTTVLLNADLAKKGTVNCNFPAVTGAIHSTFGRQFLQDIYLSLSKYTPGVATGNFIRLYFVNAEGNQSLAVGQSVKTLTGAPGFFQDMVDVIVTPRGFSCTCMNESIASVSNPFSILMSSNVQDCPFITRSDNYTEWSATDGKKTVSGGNGKSSVGGGVLALDSVGSELDTLASEFPGGCSFSQVFNAEDGPFSETYHPQFNMIVPLT